jgi:hypothetical protein
VSSRFWNRRRRRKEEVYEGMDNVFHIIPASAGAFTFMWVIGTVLVVVVVGVTLLLYSVANQGRNATFTIGDTGLDIGPGVYGRFIPREKIETDGVKVIDLKIDKDYALKRKTNGSNLPGYDAGWFRLENGEKALVFVTDKSRVVYIPTTDNYSVLLSTLHAEEMAGALRAWR